MARPTAIVAGTMIRAVSRCVRPVLFFVGETVTRMVRDLRVTEPASLHYVQVQTDSKCEPIHLDRCVPKQDRCLIGSSEIAWSD